MSLPAEALLLIVHLNLIDDPVNERWGTCRLNRALISGVHVLPVLGKELTHQMVHVLARIFGIKLFCEYLTNGPLCVILGNNLLL